MTHRFTYLSREDVRKSVTMAEAIELMSEAFGLLSSGAATLPVRQNLAVPEVRGEFLLMPVCVPQLQHFALKTVSIHGGNGDVGLPFIHAMILLLHAQTGQPQALMDGEWLTALRTGAASGLATRLLARPDASVAAIVGAGVQARTQLEAISLVRPIKTAWVLNRDPKRAERFAQEMSDALNVEVKVAPSADVLGEADIICTATSSPKPLFQACHINAGTHINAVGAYRANMHEVPGAIVARARVIVDQREAALREAGDLLIPMAQGLFEADHIRGELGELIEHAALGRTAPGDITLFKSVGNAVQDLAVAACAFKNATSKGFGNRLPL